MTRRQRAAAAIGTIALAIGGLVYGTGILAGDVCVTQFEDPGLGGDQLTTCSTTPSNVKIANLTTHTEGLTNGCNRVTNTSSTWSDCISSARISALPANQKVVWYQNTFYGNAIHCDDVNGNSTVAFTGGDNDIISSFRILGGNC